MGSRVWGLLRWVIALGLCALVVAFGVPMAIDALTSSVVIGEDIEDDEDDTEEGEGEPPGEVPSGPVSDGEAEPEADFTVREGTVDQVSRSELSLRAEGHVAVLRFPLIDGAPECVASAELQMSLLEAERTEVAVFAGPLETFEEGEEVEDPRQDDTQHALALTDGSPGRLRWDVTDFYREWASGDLAPAGSPFVVAVAAIGSPATVIFASSEAEDEDPPTLVWEGESGCGDSDDS